MAKKLDTLTCLRFIMIITIVISHFSFLGYEDSSIFSLYISNAAIALDFFFILSGFGLTYSLLHKQIEHIDISITQSIKNAYKRMKKLYWLYILIMLTGGSLYIIINQAVKSGELSEILFALTRIGLVATLTQSITGVETFSHAISGPFWFLSCLFFLYIAHPWLFNLLRKSCYDATRSCYTLLFLTIAFICTYQLLRIVEDRTFFENISLQHPLGRCLQFCIGITFGFMYFRLKDKKLFPSPTALEIFVSALFILYFFSRTTMNVHATFKTLTDLIVASSLIFVFLFQQGEISKRMLRCRWLIVLGDISMYIYLIHFPIMTKIYILVSFFTDVTAYKNTLTIIGTFVMSIMVSVLIKILVDRKKAFRPISSQSPINVDLNQPKIDV